MKTVDIDDFAQAVKSSLIRYLVAALGEVPQVKVILAVPIIGPLFKRILEWVIGLAVGQAGLAAFIINTRVFTGAQAKDYMAALEKLRSAPDNIPNEEWEKLEGKANEAFYMLVRFSR